MDDDERATPRWLQDHQPPAPTERELQVLREVLASIRRVKHGQIQISLQDGRVVQIDITEKRRL